MPAYDLVSSVEISAKTNPMGMLTNGLNDSMMARLKLKRNKKASPRETATTDKSIKIITQRGKKVNRSISLCSTEVCVSFDCLIITP
jgi:hypothetical protein